MTSILCYKKDEIFYLFSSSVAARIHLQHIEPHLSSESEHSSSLARPCPTFDESSVAETIQSIIINLVLGVSSSFLAGQLTVAPYNMLWSGNKSFKYLCAIQNGIFLIMNEVKSLPDSVLL